MKKITIFIFLLFIFACSNNSKSSTNSNFVENKSSQLVDSEYKVDRNDEDSKSSNDNEFGSGQQKSKSSENEELDDNSYVLAIDFNPESGNYIRANYRVKEQLARLPSPIEAVGYTESITGGIYIDSEGNLSHNSVINIDLSTLKSDESRRDNYLRGSSLETDKFPQATFKVLDIQGLDLTSLISSQKNDFQIQMIGDLSIHGVTKRKSWNIDATYQMGKLKGKGSVEFPFSDFDMDIPQLFFIISVEDKITLELDFDVLLSFAPSSN